MPTLNQINAAKTTIQNILPLVDKLWDIVGLAERQKLRGEVIPDVNLSAASKNALKRRIILRKER